MFFRKFKVSLWFMRHKLCRWTLKIFGNFLTVTNHNVNKLLNIHKDFDLKKSQVAGSSWRFERLIVDGYAFNCTVKKTESTCSTKINGQKIKNNCNKNITALISENVYRTAVKHFLWWNKVNENLQIVVSARAQPGKGCPPGGFSAITSHDLLV